MAALRPGAAIFNDIESQKPDSRRNAGKCDAKDLGLKHVNPKKLIRY